MLLQSLSILTLFVVSPEKDMVTFVAKLYPTDWVCLYASEVCNMYVVCRLTDYWSTALLIPVRKLAILVIWRQRTDGTDRIWDPDQNSTCSCSTLFVFHSQKVYVLSKCFLVRNTGCLITNTFLVEPNRIFFSSETTVGRFHLQSIYHRSSTQQS